MFSHRLTLGLLAAIGSAHAQKQGSQWAVLVAGSYEFHNYRHQAGICRAHKVLRDRGFDEEKIITMIVDDVATSPRNPIPGKLFNEPAEAMEGAVDVHAGCNPDYRGLEGVTPENFLAVLRGDREKAKGKVLGSGSDDTVFVNFVDHGAVGLVAFPTGHLHAKTLLATLMTMAERRMFRRLLFYMEACESGSMFQDLLPGNLSISALTSASADEPSYGIFCDEEASVGGVAIRACLGDEFGVRWMRDSQFSLPWETVAEQFERVREATEKSHVQRFGEGFEGQLLSYFQGEGRRGATRTEAMEGRRVSGRDVKLEMLREESARTGDNETLVAELEERRAVEMLRRVIVREALGEEELAGGAFTWTWPLLECHESAAAAFAEACGWSESRLLLSETLLRLCQRQPRREAILGGIRRACGAEEALMV